MHDNMELFTKMGSRDDAGVVSVNARGLLGLSAACMQNNFVGKDYAQLFMSPDKTTVGIKPCEKGAPHAFKLIKTASRPTAHIFAKSFFDYHRVDYSVTRRFYPKWSDENEMLMMNLESGVDVR